MANPTDPGAYQHLSLCLITQCWVQINVLYVSHKPWSKSSLVTMQGIVVYLVKLLDRINIELLILATAFLKKLSIYQENKDQMAACDVVTRLVKLMAVDNDVLLMAVLRLLHNLSFDGALRDEMVKQGLLPKVKNQCAADGGAAALAHPVP